MIPLGSCTMKLNATTEMEPISYDGFANLHPFAPIEDAQGYAILITTLESWLAEITGTPGCRFSPMPAARESWQACSAIRRYHDARGDTIAGLLDPVFGAWHQRRIRRDGRNEGSGRDRHGRRLRGSR